MDIYIKGNASILYGHAKMYKTPVTIRKARFTVFDVTQVSELVGLAHEQTRGNASVGEVARWRNSHGEQYFKALCGCDSL